MYITHEEPLDGKETIELTLEKELVYELMLEAHRRDITFNQLVELILQEFIAQEGNDAS